MQRHAMGLMIAVCLLLLAAGKSDSTTLSFKDDKVGELPKGWSAAKTGTGEGSVWKVVADESSADDGKALAQVSDKGSGGLFNLCVVDDSSYKDLDFSLGFKAVAGKEDQGGGPVWRYKDSNNYYIARMNPLEDNFRVYKVVDGKRTQLGTANVEAEAGKWHMIRITQKGDHITCYLNGQPYLDVKDDTFKDAGKIGLWTKADAQTRFAEIMVEVEK